MSGDSFQIYFHPKLGVVIYDPVAQMGFAREQMRLFKLGAMGASTFMREIVSKDLAACDDTRMQQFAAAVGVYRSARSGRRKPYCEHCRRHFRSVDFTVCGGCNSILHVRHLQLRFEFPAPQSGLSLAGALILAMRRLSLRPSLASQPALIQACF